MDMTTPDLSLDLIGAMRGTNKSSHGFLDHYERLFKEFRHMTFNMIEFGVERGESLATWQDYFDKATIIGVDIKESCRQFQRDRAIVQIGSQDDPGFLSDLARQYPPHIIIDDASHFAHHIIFTFERLFPSLAPGGLYIVEDLHFHAGVTMESSRGYSDINPVDYFATLARAITLMERPPELQWGLQGYLRKYIDEITFFNRGLAVRKVAPQARRAEQVSGAVRFAEREGTMDGWERTAQYLQRNGAHEHAIEAVQNAIKIQPHARLYLQLGMIQAARGDRRSGLASVQLAIKQAQGSAELGNCLEHYGDLLKVEARFDEALESYRDALPLAIQPVIRERIEVKIKAVGGQL
jgi:tetratricopeptide (TPR) repeat protein